MPAATKRAAGVKGEIDHFGALSFLQGLLVVLPVLARGHFFANEFRVELRVRFE